MNTAPYPAPIDVIEARVRAGRLDPDLVLRHEYGARYPRYSLIEWLKRHGASPATTQVVSTNLTSTTGLRRAA